MPFNLDPTEISRLTERALKHVHDVLGRDSKAIADTLTADDDPVLGVLLRFHLIAEQVFDRVFACSFRYASHLEDARPSFAQKLTLLRALGVVPDDAVEAMKRVNSLRNRCAHVQAHGISSLDIDRIGEAIGPAYREFQRLYSANLKVLTIFTLSKLYEPFLLAALTAEAVATVKADEDAR